jgi:hypothetical protein
MRPLGGVYSQILAQRSLDGHKGLKISIYGRKALRNEVCATPPPTFTLALYLPLNHAVVSSARAHTHPSSGRQMDLSNSL